MQQQAFEISQRKRLLIGCVVGGRPSETSSRCCSTTMAELFRYQPITCIRVPCDCRRPDCDSESCRNGGKQLLLPTN
ncbi:hypothetical protein HOLleu_35643 [Holothuria leucospilota]|uniref:Uncharacterized protein n=1 Tax=Holothuria leucospilota TaxID=206669 RepID=A0A9Q0YKX2_HOLLE|nr:hypothetical protein HOLleu_35643 [Holothuria leucospilota]